MEHTRGGPNGIELTAARVILSLSFRYIVLWFLMSDGAFLIGNVGALMARVTVMPEPYSVQHE